MAKNFINFIYYCPYSDKNISNSENDYLQEKFVKNKTFLIEKDSDVQAVADRIVTKIKLFLTTYEKEIKENSHTLFLSHFFQKKFQAFIRAEHFLDAVVEIEIEEEKEIVKKLDQANVSTYHLSRLKHEYLVIPHVNTKEVADKIRLLK